MRVQVIRVPHTKFTRISASFLGLQAVCRWNRVCWWDGGDRADNAWVVYKWQPLGWTHYVREERLSIRHRSPEAMAMPWRGIGMSRWETHRTIPLAGHKQQQQQR